MLPRLFRLRKRRDFRATMSRSRQGSYSSALMSITVRTQRRGGEGAGGILRFGFSISKKVAKRAHVRNRIKRRLSELARTVVVPAYAKDAPKDCVVVARGPLSEASFTDLKTDFLQLLIRAGVYEERTEAKGLPESCGASS